ncbi:MAG: beta-galactosidase [bacterium]|nr:beta-galactosidase [bacterium]
MFRNRFLVRRVLYILAVGAMALPAGALSVRVNPAEGAPRLEVDGKPVRARMFWGGPGSSAIVVASDWREVKFTFTAGDSADNGTMQFRFGPRPGDVYLDDIHVTDLDESKDLIPLNGFEKGMEDFNRDWRTWPTDTADSGGTVSVDPGAGCDRTAALHVIITSREGRRRAEGRGRSDFHIAHQERLHIVKGHRYEVSFWARATQSRQLQVGFYRPGATYTQIGAPPDTFGSQIKLAAGAGVNFFSFLTDAPWPEPGQPADWTKLDSLCDAVLEANPQALLLVRLNLNPPVWWGKAHPDDVMQWEDGRRRPETGFSAPVGGVVASPQYRHDAAQTLAATVAHLEEKYGDHVAGYHPSGQNTNEWFYLDTWSKTLNGYAPADRIAWRKWLAAHYADDAALRRAWNNPGVIRATAEVPAAAARHAAPAGILRDPATEQTLIDWAQFQQEAMSDLVCELAHVVRQATQGRKLVVFFYGYIFEFAAVANGPATSGHFALRRVLDCPDIDVLCSPISYHDRGLGQSAPSMTAAESVALADKMWLNEDDTHTYLATGTPPGAADHVDTLEETNAELTRNVAQAALRNFGTWWMDLGRRGWFDNAAMWAEMKKLDVLDQAMLDHPTPFLPEIAVVNDERSMLRVAAGGNLVTTPLITAVRAQFGRVGAPYGQYLLDDVLKGRVHAKLYVFLNAWCLSPEDRARLLEATQGAMCIWCYAPGYYELVSDAPARKASPDAIKELTGFGLVSVEPETAMATPTEAGEKLGLQTPFGVKAVPKPLFAAEGAGDGEVLATYSNGAAAVTMHDSPGGASFFVGVPSLSTELIRAAARTAGVRLYTDTDCNVYANNGFLALHGSKDGPVTIDVGAAGPVEDVLDGKPIGTGPKFILDLKKGDTLVLRLPER